MYDFQSDPNALAIHFVMSLKLVKQLKCRLLSVIVISM